ncbi:MAG: erythromycin esterase family protein [Kofleriaceae bacterium]
MSLPTGEPEAIAQIARPIHGEDELDQLVDLVSHARIVCLGESTHGSHEFYQLRAAVTRRLIAQHGFSAIAIEGDWPDALRTDRYVRQLGDDEAASAALASFQRFPTWMWRNQDVVDLVDWLRDFNRDRAPHARAGFYGLDLYSLHASIRSVLSFLDQADPTLAAEARERYACFDHAGGDPQRYGMRAFHGLTDDCEDQVIEQLVEMQRRRAARSGRTPAGDAWFQAIQNAHVVKDAEAYYRTMFGGRSASWNLRDRHMAVRVERLAAHLGSTGEPARLVVWAHNSHIGDARATAMGRDGQLTLGQLLRQRHGDAVALVGFTTHTGWVECACDWEQPGRRERVRPSLRGSWEELFHDTGLARFMVESAALRPVIGEHAERLHRAIGVVYRPDTERRSHYYESRIADQYDVIVHLDETDAVVPIDRQDASAASTTLDLPETFPTGM